ncbi:ABC transporter permease [Bacillus sp. CGMCC 1.16607]|uniref:ABC transporter permease n=1 Tax=Bacillus sp. CGMCC 1.16607 TaxID=3351842 RepID=UPI003641C704
MASLIGLIQNENMKIYRRVGTWVMIGLLILATVAGAILSSKLGNNNKNSDWKTELSATTKQLEADVANPDIPKAFKKMQEKQLEINKYRLEHNIAPLEGSTLWGYTLDAAEIITFITLFTVIVAAGSVASEFSWGTIKLLLIRPASRGKILLAKYISTILFALFLLVVLLLTSMLIGGIVYGFGHLNLPHLAYSSGKVVEVSMLSHILSIYGLNSIQLIMMVTFAFMISSVFRSSSLAIGLAIFLMFMGSQLTHLISMKFDWAKYILFANMDLTQYIDGVPLVEGMTMTFSIIMLIIYFIGFNALSWIIFRKRDIAA